MEDLRVTHRWNYTFYFGDSIYIYVCMYVCLFYKPEFSVHGRGRSVGFLYSLLGIVKDMKNKWVKESGDFYVNRKVSLVF